MNEGLRAVVPVPMPGLFAVRTLEARLPWLDELAPAGSGARLTPASSSGQVSRVAKAVSADAAQWAVEVGRDVAERVAAEIPGHVADNGFEVLRMGTESATLQLLLALSGVQLSAAATSESLSGVPEFVRRRVSLDDMLRGIQLGHSVIAAAFLTECARLGDPSQRSEQMRTLSERMFVFFDAFSTEMAAFYREEERRWAKSDAVERFALVEDVLRGHDQSEALVSRRLRYDLSRAHVALVVWSSARSLDVDPGAMHDTACDLIRRIGCEQKLVLDAGPAVVWAWITLQAGLDIRTRIAMAQLPPSTHVAFAGPAQGTAGFRSVHRDALAVFALQSRHPDPASVTDYRDVDLLSLLLADRPRAIGFARSELGALAKEGAAMDEIRRTLAAYLDVGGSPQIAAARLRISRNTVTYRVKRAEELLGRPVAVRRAQLQAALAVYEKAMR
ncbi:PucR family transcriptional regulator [Rathayibacter sp. CAU 1779]